jgi:hypothetical protein
MLLLHVSALYERYLQGAQRILMGALYSEKLKQLSKQLLAAKKTAQEAFLKSKFSNESKCWTE